MEHSEQVITQVNHLGHAWKQYREASDDRFSQIERKLESADIVAARPPLAAPTITNSSENFDDEYKQAFNTYLRTGLDNKITELQHKLLLSNNLANNPTFADSGFYLSSSMEQLINQKVDNKSSMRSICRIDTISSDALELLNDSGTIATAGWSDGVATPALKTTFTLTKRSLSVFNLYAQPSLTQKFLDDARIDVEDYLAEEIADAFALKESAAFVSGDGTTQPKGFLTYVGTGLGQLVPVNSGVAGAITADSILKLYYTLDSKYIQDAAFVMNRATVNTIKNLKDNTGNYLWRPGLSNGDDGTLLGAKVIQCSAMPTIAVDALPIAFGNFYKGYRIVDRSRTRVLRDPFSLKPLVSFYTTKRVGGDLVDSSAIVLLKTSV